MTDLIYKSLTQIVEEKDVPLGKDISECGFKEKWGFTIYRTTYGSESERYWEAIINDLQAQVPTSLSERVQSSRNHGEGTRSWVDPGEPATEAQEILSLFRLDPRSDEKRLAGLTMQQTRENFLQETNNTQDLRPMNTFRPKMLGNHLLLLVDDEVISAAASGQGQQLWVKCVDADYKAENAVPRNPRVRQTYFGWMKMTTRSLVDFREHLETFREFERIAPPMLTEVGRDAMVYDGDMFMSELWPVKYGLGGTSIDQLTDLDF